VSTHLTVDELAQAAGLPTSTIRLYRQRGLLPAPAMEGRVGYFDDGHLARLRLIAELRERGFSLAAIKELVDGWEQGRDLGGVLGVERALAATGADESQTMSRADLARRFPELDAAPALWDRLVAAGVIEPGDEEVVVFTGFLNVATMLHGLGVPLDVMLDEFSPVQQFARDAAARFVGLFERYVLDAAPTVDPSALGQVIAALRAAGVSVVSGALQRAIDEAAADAVARYAERGTSVHGDRESSSVH
jgi:DNA-binding transcriptional MerR regulator